MLKAQGIVPQSPVPSPPPDDLPGPSVKTEGGKSKGKGVKREREENGSDDVIEISSDDGDLESLQVTRATSHILRLLTASAPRMNSKVSRNEFQGKRQRNQ